MTTGFAPVVFEAPLVNPAPNGLFAATNWQTTDGPLRWLASGVDVRVFNYGGADAYGVWTAPWCGATEDLDPGDVKEGTRPEFPDSFEAFTSWATDECDLTARSQAEVLTRAEQTHRLQEPNAVETAFSARLLTDGGTPAAAADIVEAVSKLEAAIALTNTVGFIHAGAQWAAYAAQAQLIVRSGTGLKTPLGNTWVFGGGYVAGLADVLVATSPTFGWRGTVTIQGAMKLEWNRFKAVAERSLVVGYEAAIAAVDIA
jgi:hypothetical protein